MCASELEIDFRDLGAGSDGNEHRKVLVSSLAKHSLSTPAQCRILFHLVQHLKAEQILELGTSLGIATSYLAHATAGSVYTIEGSESVAELAKNNWKDQDIKNIHSTVGDFSAVLDSVMADMPRIDMAFIDGNHRMAPTLDYFEKVLSKSHNDTVFIFDDIHWSDEMEQAWESIKKHPRSKVTLDLFWAGVVFIRQELSKEDFTIRY